VGGGICMGNTEITEDLTLLGQQPNGFSVPTLLGTGSGSVLTVDSGVTLDLESMGGPKPLQAPITIAGGTGTFDPTFLGTEGGGIFNSGTVNLNGGTIYGNTASSGGGIFNGSGTLNVSGGTVSGNSAALDGGGIFNNSSTLNLNGGSIRDNMAAEGGGIFTPSGTLNNDVTTITGNIPDNVDPSYDSYD
jgi:hypothetical protein